MAVIDVSWGSSSRDKVPMIIGANRRDLLRQLRGRKKASSVLHAGLPLHVFKSKHDFLVAPAELYTNDFVL